MVLFQYFFNLLSWKLQKKNKTKKVFERQVLSDAKLKEEQNKHAFSMRRTVVVAIWQYLFIMPDGILNELAIFVVGVKNASWMEDNYQEILSPNIYLSGGRSPSRYIYKGVLHSGRDFMEKSQFHSHWRLPPDNLMNWLVKLGSIR